MGTKALRAEAAGGPGGVKDAVFTQKYEALHSNLGVKSNSINDSKNPHTSQSREGALKGRKDSFREQARNCPGGAVLWPSVWQEPSLLPTSQTVDLGSSNRAHPEPPLACL